MPTPLTKQHHLSLHHSGFADSAQSGSSVPLKSSEKGPGKWHPGEEVLYIGFVSCMPIFGRAVKVFMCTLCTQVFAICAHVAGLLLYSITSPSSCGRASGESTFEFVFFPSIRRLGNTPWRPHDVANSHENLGATHQIACKAGERLT